MDYVIHVHRIDGTTNSLSSFSNVFEKGPLDYIHKVLTLQKEWQDRGTLISGSLIISALIQNSDGDEWVWDREP